MKLARSSKRMRQQDQNLFLGNVTLTSVNQHPATPRGAYFYHIFGIAAIRGLQNMFNL